jgi:hypothetical protein
MPKAQMVMMPRLTLALAIAASLLGSCGPAPAQGQSQVIDGLRLDYGLAAGQDAASHLPAHPESSMPAGARGAEHSYHVVLAVFEARSGRRITDAEVGVSLGRAHGHGSVILPMELMDVPGEETYGRFVTMPEPGRYRLEFRVRPRGQQQSVRARFELQRPE